MNETYLWLKTIHILGVVLFLGNIIITGWWKVMADNTKNAQVIAFAQRQVTLTDYVFTAGGAAILLLAGFANVGIHQMSFSAKWLSQGLWTVSYTHLDVYKRQPSMYLISRHEHTSTWPVPRSGAGNRVVWVPRVSNLPGVSRDS